MIKQRGRSIGYQNNVKGDLGREKDRRTKIKKGKFTAGRRKKSGGQHRMCHYRREQDDPF